MKKIALVRGSNLNKFEMQNYEPLKQHFDICCVGTTNNKYELGGISLPVLRLGTLYDRFSFLPMIKDIIASRYQGKNNLLKYEEALRDFDLIHVAETANYYSGQAMDLKKKYPSKKAVVTVWENIPFCKQGSIESQIKEKVKKEADFYIAMNEGARQALLIEGFPENKIVKIIYGVNIEKFKPKKRDPELMRSLGILEDEFVILFPSRLEWEKGIYESIYSFKRLTEKHHKNKLKLLFIGNGSGAHALEQTAKKLNIEDKVIIKPMASYDLMPDIHNLADIFMLLSIPTRGWTEQLGFVILEALACGKPIISTMSGAIPEVLGDAGILVPPRDFSGTCEALAKLYSDQELRLDLGRKARKRAEEIFDAKKVSLKIKEVYDKLLS